jgi:hypothetical protein
VKTIDELLAEAEIRDVQMRYCRASDRMDYDLLRACFHPDATFDYGAFFVGDVDGFIAVAERSLPAYSGTTHVTGNQLVEVKGDSAWAEHYTLATHRCPADDKGPLRDFVTSVRYIDRLEKRDGRWLIAKRVLILDWCRTDPVGEVELRPTARRDREDASYLLP